MCQAVCHVENIAMEIIPSVLVSENAFIKSSMKQGYDLNILLHTILEQFILSTTNNFSSFSGKFFSDSIAWPFPNTKWLL